MKKAIAVVVCGVIAATMGQGAADMWWRDVFGLE
jgi:hypothetical protein